MKTFLLLILLAISIDSFGQNKHYMVLDERVSFLIHDGTRSDFSEKRKGDVKSAVVSTDSIELSTLTKYIVIHRTSDVIYGRMDEFDWGRVRRDESIVDTYMTYEGVMEGKEVDILLLYNTTNIPELIVIENDKTTLYNLVDIFSR